MKIRFLCLALASALAGPLLAQSAGPAAPANLDAKRAELQKLEAEMQSLGARMGELARELGEGQRRIMLSRVGGDRPGMGVVLSAQNDVGVQLGAVTPGGPADKAGLKSGDVIRSLDGRNLSDDAAEAAGQIVTALRGKQNGQIVSVSYLRAGRSATANVTLAPIGRTATFDWVGENGVNTIRAHELTLHNGKMDEHGREMRKRVEIITEDVNSDGARMVTRGGPGDIRVITCISGEGDCDRELMTRAFRFRGLNLSSIDADLGRYFGTDKGALLIASSDALPGLKSGDVITAVEGRTVASPRDVMRALGAKEAGEKLTLRILRNRVAQDAEITVPAGRPLDFLPPPPPAPPAPPAAPASPSPPAPPAPPADVRLTVI